MFHLDSYMSMPNMEFLLIRKFFLLDQILTYIKLCKLKDPSCYDIQWNLSKADTYGTEVFVRFREVSTLEMFKLKSSQI